ncbi:MAG: hypothetical protein IJA98_01465, partial [Bacteroidaceae bacterium]|nr:hypothetical protein [Bacteroidaceae bacterium]
FSLFEALFTIFTLFVLANRPLFAATKQCKSAQKHLSTKLEIKSKQILNGIEIFMKHLGSTFAASKRKTTQSDQIEKKYLVKNKKKKL